MAAGADVFLFNNTPDGLNINKDCGSLYPEMMCRKVWEHRAHIGIAHDGDADRVLLCDETGKLIDGDDILAICALDMLRQGTLNKNTLVATVMSNAGLDAAIQAAGGQTIRASVGDKSVIDEMLRGDYNLGGEQSGHLIFRDYTTTGDGLVSALQIMRIMKARNLPLSELRQCWTRFPQLLSNFRVREKPPLEQLEGVSDLLAQAEAEIKPGGGRVMLRYSGTEPKARLLLEGQDLSVLERWSKKIGESIKKQIGA